MARRLRLLCLHGFGTNRTVMEFQMGQLARSHKELDLVFVDGPLLSTPAPGIQTFFPEGPYFKFYDTDYSAVGPSGRSPTYTGIDAAIEWCTAKLDELGPFDGVIGFSQGANMAAMLAASASTAVRWAVCICGVDSGWGEQMTALFPPDTPVQVPTLHVLAKEDGYLPLGEVLRSRFEAPDTIYHSGDHRPFPTDRTEAKTVADKIAQFAARCSTI